MQADVTPYSPLEYPRDAPAANAPGAIGPRAHRWLVQCHIPDTEPGAVEADSDGVCASLWPRNLWHGFQKKKAAALTHGGRLRKQRYL